MVIRLTKFHLFGKTPFRRQPLYKVVIYLGNISKALLNTSQVIPFSPGAFFFFVLATAFLVSSTVKCLSSSVSAGSRVGLGLVCGVQCRFLLYLPAWSAQAWAVGVLSSLHVRIPRAFAELLFVCCSFSSLLPIYILLSTVWKMTLDCNIPSRNVFSPI